MPSHAAPRRHLSRWTWVVAAAAVVALALVVRPALGQVTAPAAAPATPPSTVPAGTTAIAATTSAAATATATTARATRSPSPAARPVTIPLSASGRLAVVPGRAGPSGPGTVLRYRLEIEVGLPLDGVAIAAQVQRVLTDPRGWQPIEHVAFARVDGPADFELVIASPTLVDKLCYPLDTIGQLSCRNGDRVVLNALRWATAVPWYAGRMDDYRAYLVNHEVGHRLGHGHAQCHGAGLPAPVMMQQSKGIGACRANPWPAVAAV